MAADSSQCRTDVRVAGGARSPQHVHHRGSTLARYLREHLPGLGAPASARSSPRNHGCEPLAAHATHCRDVLAGTQAESQDHPALVLGELQDLLCGVGGPFRASLRQDGHELVLSLQQAVADLSRVNYAPSPHRGWRKFF